MDGLSGYNIPRLSAGRQFAPVVLDRPEKSSRADGRVALPAYQQDGGDLCQLARQADPGFRDRRVSMRG